MDQGAAAGAGRWKALEGLGWWGALGDWGASASVRDGVALALWWNAKLYLKVVAGYFKGVFGRSCLIAPNHPCSTFLTQGDCCWTWSGGR